MEDQKDEFELLTVSDWFEKEAKKDSLLAIQKVSILFDLDIIKNGKTSEK